MLSDFDPLTFGNLDLWTGHDCGIEGSIGRASEVRTERIDDGDIAFYYSGTVIPDADAVFFPNESGLGNL